MSQIINLLNSLLPYIVLLAVGIVAVYQYAKQHNPAFAEKMKWLYDVAQYIVAQQETYPVTGEQKKQAATEALLEQAKANKANLTEETAKGMIEKAYQEGVKNETK